MKGENVLKTIIVDDEPLAIERVKAISMDIPKVNIVETFDSPYNALEYSKDNEVDLAILDINMPEIDGIELGKKLRELQPKIVLIYVTGYEEYALDAYNIYAAAYLLKPFNKDDLLYAIESAVLLSKRDDKKVFIKTFGRFDVFVNGKPVFFKSAKSKELLALLVNANGSTITSGYATSILWEDKTDDESTKNLYYKVAKSLEKTLKENEIEKIIIKNRYAICINKSELSCDYYKLLLGDKEVRKNFTQEYMSQYSWAEETLAHIINHIK